MNSSPAIAAPARILVIDDNPAIHDDIQKILARPVPASDRMDALKSALFGDRLPDPSSSPAPFEIDSAYQGEQGLERVDAAAAAGRPYALAFVDVRMPPGWDGVETITRIWQRHPDLQVVICTAYSDYSWEEMVRHLGRSSNMVVLKKPFDNVEVLQLAHALTEKWRLGHQVRDHIRELDQRVECRTADLRAANAELKREIAERQQAERALVLSEERFSKAFQANPIPLAILASRRATFLDVNEGFATLVGRTREEISGRTPAELQLFGEAVDALPDTLRADQALRHHPCEFRTRSGARRDVLLSSALIDLNGEVCLLLIAQDITEQLLLEKQLRHSQKMEAIGQLAAGIAHDFNNMLTVIQGSASLLMLDQPADAPDRPMLESILSASQRSARLVRQLLTFSHKHAREVRNVDVTELFDFLGETLPRMLGEQVIVRTRVAPQLPPVSADVGMVEQMLVNLAVNARDAMPRGGELTITGELVDIPTDHARSAPEARAGHFLCFAVCDTGTGIPPEVLPRIFEPFYTTKPVGKGTGLGLATAYGIVRQHQGWIEVESEVGHGTTFRVFLPAALTALAVAAKETARKTERGAGERVLVVEDEETVRRCVVSVLQANGYQVVTANHGVEALAVWARRTQPFDLLLTDMVMPENVTGLELAKQLLAEKPELKVIFTSGYSRELSASNAPFLKQHRFLPKPYQADALLHAVRESLDAVRQPMAS